MPNIKTGQTAHEIVVSFDTTNNSPISGATFNTVIFEDGVYNSGITITSTLIDATRAVFDFSWSASTTGTYQLHIKNNVNDVVYISDIYEVWPDNYFDTTIYVGL